MKKTLLTAAALASFAAVPAQAWAGSMASSSVVNVTINIIGGQNFFISGGSAGLPAGLINAYQTANYHGKVGIWNAIGNHYKSRGC